MRRRKRRWGRRRPPTEIRREALLAPAKRWAGWEGDGRQPRILGFDGDVLMGSWGEANGSLDLNPTAKKYD